MEERIRDAVIGDSDELLEIYAPYVRDTVISLEIAVPGREDFRKRVAGILSAYPYLVYEAEGKIAGYAYATKQMEREGYRYNVSVSVYLRPEFQGRGIGKKLYSRLLPLVKERGYRNAYAGITLPNPRSVGLHQSFGFTQVGVYHHTGYKFGRWHDVVWLEKDLGNGEGDS